MGVKQFIGNQIAEGAKEYVENELDKIKKSGKDVVSYKNTYAAFNLIKYKTELRIFIFSTLVSIIFLGFYGYLIYLNIDVYSLRHIIIYSVLSVLLIISLGFNIAFYPMKKKKMSTNEKAKRKNIIEKEKNIVMLVQTLTKLTSLGFMLYEIVTIDSSLKRVLPFGLSTIALIFQIIITYISRLIVNYYDILLIGINKDINNSGIIDILDEKKVVKEPLYVSTGISENKTVKISNDLKEQVKNDKIVSDKNKKDFLYDLAMYCLADLRKKEDVMNKYKIPTNTADNQLEKLSKLSILKVKEDTTVEMLIVDATKIKELIYK